MLMNRSALIEMSAHGKMMKKQTAAKCSQL